MIHSYIQSIQNKNASDSFYVIKVWSPQKRNNSSNNVTSYRAFVVFSCYC